MNRESTYIRLPDNLIKPLVSKPLLSEILVISSGYRYGDTRLGKYTNKPAADKYFLHYCHSGEGYITVDNHTYTLQKGDLIFCKPNHQHIYGADSTNPYETYWVYFTGHKSDDYVDMVTDNSDQPLIYLKSDSSIVAYFEEIIDVMHKGYSETYLLEASNRLKLLLTRLHQGNNETEGAYPLDSLISFMARNLDKMITLEQLAGEMNLSKDYFTKLFHKKYGYTPIDYFIRMKMQRACQLLVGTDYAIKKIAHSLGYQDNLYFSRVFKQKLGCTPSSYRKNNE